MDHKLYTSIGSIIIFSIWLFVAITAIKEYIRVIKTPGLSPFMTKKDITEIKDYALLEAIYRWKRVVRRLFALWIASVIVYMLVSIIIDRTIAFKNF